ncbi:MAG TPA: hypothetical protein VFB76_20055 [Candidatus Angelobacter sp.]|nr:hypothetical protein [Candidatus Angelobacter sp.]
MLVKAAFVLLALSVGAIVAIVVIMRWRLRGHMRRADVTPPAATLEAQPQEPVEKA